jgi:addiction module HigA family antidote
MSRTPIHPGEILGDELKEIGMTGAACSRILKVPENRIPAIIRGSRNITPDTALRLGKWFGTSPEFWMNLQRSYELRKAKLEIATEIEQIPTR